MPPSRTDTHTTRSLARVDTAKLLPERGLGVLLLVEKIALIENPDYIPSCNVNPVLSCGSVMTTRQAEAFGIPNPILGTAGFAVIAAIGAGLLAEARFASWFWIVVQAG